MRRAKHLMALPTFRTIQFRIYYPALPESKGKRITWLPAPQRLHVSGYTQFLGIGPLMGSVLS